VALTSKRDRPAYSFQLLTTWHSTCKPGRRVAVCHRRTNRDYQARRLKMSRQMIAGWCCGLATGLAVGILFAPKSGKDLRREMKHSVAEKANSVKDQVRDVANKANARLQDVTNAGKDLASTAKSELSNVGRELASAGREVANSATQKVG
jgi:gas vesicle protein